MASGLPFALYNPALLSADALLGEFIARRGLLNALLETVRENAKGHAPQHVLLVGARGMGKTTTLWAVAHSVNRDAALVKEWQPVVFDEESRRVGDLADFWLEAIRQWEHATKDPRDRTQALLDQASADIEDRARQVFLDGVKASGRRALLLIDNLNEVLVSIKDSESLHRLRAFLMEESQVMLIGGATRYFPEVTDVDQPFYDFFRTFDLKPLTLEEMKTCLLALAESRGGDIVKQAVHERGGTMRSLHLLTGGNPRLIKTFYRLLAEGLRGDIRADLERLLDEFTPYFKSIVDALPTQQQRIFDAVALNWDPVDVAAIAHATRLPSNQISSQLRILVKAGHVSEAAGHPKRKSYLIADRFSNIHYLMRHGRAAGNRFNWFVAILRLIFPDQSHATLAKLARESAECGPDGMHDARELLHCALSRADSAESRRQLLHATFSESWNSDTFSSFAHWFDLAEARRHLPESDVLAFFQQMPTDLRKKLQYEPQSAEWWYKLTDFLEEKSAWPLAEAAYRKAIKLDPKFSYPWNGLGNLLMRHLGKFAEAEAAYRKAIELDPKSAHPWNGLGNLLKKHLGRIAEAEVAYRKAIELDSNSAYPWDNLGVLLDEHLGKFAEAETAYRKAIELDPKDASPWINLGILLMERFERFQEAEAAYRKAIELDPKEASPWNNLGNLFMKRLGKFTDAEVAYLKAIELNSNHPSPWINLGILLTHHLERFTEAETAYRNAIKLVPDNGVPWANLAEVLAEKLQRDQDARECAIRSLVLDPTYRFSRHIFIKLCTNHAGDWRAVLPTLSTWCTIHPKASDVFAFTIDGFISLARLSKPTEALALLESAPEAVSAFETLRDAFLAHGDRNHLDRLAPERRVVAIELLNRISAAQDTPS